jgi:hypothetical protein
MFLSCRAVCLDVIGAFGNSEFFFKTAVSIAMDHFLQTIEKATIKIT